MSSIVTIAFFTGQSDRGRCALSPLQKAFLARLNGPGRRLIPVNFPYAESAPYRDTSLLTASWNNVWQTLASQRPSFARRHASAVATLLAGSTHTVFLAGSCGLELFNNLRLAPELERRCTLIAYGPVARRLPHFARCLLVQGRRDGLTRLAFPGRRPALACGHLDYLTDPGFPALCTAQLDLLAPRPCSSTSA